ncbi:uncharacterized protein LOC133331355 [Musca vetustissima]|uniref:uncharacterized protein LOC133331355 n=1 Tax=Musca vetustissima TaxID=27455 RepID=UPI002AB642C5|nr:uncharacterized protein LOC133331355 [Musca vetustissima]
MSSEEMTATTTTLNVLCAICSEYFKSNDIIYCTTKCGHVFHHKCLTRWLSQSTTCPQCRAVCHRHMIHRIYLNFSEPTAQDDELDAEPVNTFDWYPLDSSMDPKEIASFSYKLGTDADGDAIYAARVYFKDDLLPAYYVPKKKGAYCAWGGGGHFVENDIELLYTSDDKADYKWVSAENGAVPENAFVCGYTDRGESLYFGRANYEGLIRYGKIHPSHRCCYIPYEELEKNNRSYEVLVRIPATTTTESSPQ